jgi:hypothetical protein
MCHILSRGAQLTRPSFWYKIGQRILSGVTPLPSTTAPSSDYYAYRGGSSISAGSLHWMLMNFSSSCWPWCRANPRSRRPDLPLICPVKLSARHRPPLSDGARLRLRPPSCFTLLTSAYSRCICSLDHSKRRCFWWLDLTIVCCRSIILCYIDVNCVFS